MLSQDDMKQLNNAYRSNSAVDPEAFLAQLGNPSDATVVATALAGMDNTDRNVRVLMLRVLAHYSGPEAMNGIRRGLGDDERRVREVALKSSANYLGFAEITERMVELATDEDEKAKIRHLALDSLAGLVGGTAVVQLPANAAGALARLAEQSNLRMPVLQRLVCLDMTDEVATLLRSYAAGSDAGEARLAAKALAGYRVVNLGSFPDKARRQEVAATCELAYGHVFYWVPRAEPVVEAVS